MSDKTRELALQLAGLHANPGDSATVTLHRAALYADFLSGKEELVRFVDVKDVTWDAHPPQ